MKGGYSRKSVLTGITSFLTVLFTTPLGHALMISMEYVLSFTALHYAVPTMGAIGLVMVIIGMFAKGDIRQTLWGLFGRLLFWTGWVEFIYVYYVHRYEVQSLLNVAGEVVTKSEHLIIPPSFGFWVMLMLIHILSIKSGCDFFIYLQKVFFRKSIVTTVAWPMIHHASIVTFMELNLIMWTSYLMLLFCYDESFVGEYSPVTAIVAFGCPAGSFFMSKRLLKIIQWRYAVRFSIATIVVSWILVEVSGRRNILHEMQVESMAYTTEMIMILLAFSALLAFLFYQSAKEKNSHN